MDLLLFFFVFYILPQFNVLLKNENLNLNSCLWKLICLTSE